MLLSVGDIVSRDGATVVIDGHVFDAEGNSTDEGYRCIVDHRTAQLIVYEFDEGSCWPEVEVEDRQIMGRI